VASAPLRYDDLKRFAADLGRPASALIAMSHHNDPFAITDHRRASAQWFTRIWKRFGGPGVHLRRVHYTMISQTPPIKMPDTTGYKNTLDCWQALVRASNDARYLDLVAAEDFVDRRNNEPLIYLPDDEREASLNLSDSLDIEAESPRSMPLLPRLSLTRPNILQRYHVELWCEKTTVNDILIDIAESYGCNLITGMGDLSQTACVNLVERAEQSGRPVRILYISDFDPSGQSMPVAVARKIEHRLYLKELSLDIQVRPIALTFDQCQRYRLPRTPLKDHPSVPIFEDRYGEGATELDALEARRPGELRRIVTKEIERYFDDDLYDAITETATETETEIAEITRGVHTKHKAKIKQLQAA